MQWIRAQLLLCFVLGLVVLMAPRPAGAQLAPTGGHYAARGTDTGFSGDVVANGDYGGTVSLDLPPVRGNAALPVHLNYVGNHFGAAGLGWDLPLSFIRLDKTFDHRRPVVNGNSGIFGREELVLMLDGQKVPLVPKGSAWMGQLNPQIEVRQQGSNFVMYDGAGRTLTFVVISNALGNRAVWFLQEIKGTDGSDVLLTYRVTSPPPSPMIPAGDAISVELSKVQYNPSPVSPGCWKNEIGIGYGADAAAPLSISYLNRVTLVRTRVITTIDTYGRTACGAGTVLLRRHALTYATDADTAQPRLQSVSVAGKTGTPERSQSLPLGTFAYGAASIDGKGGRQLHYRLQSHITMPDALRGEPLQDTFAVGHAHGAQAWDMLTALIDLTGDGRPDFLGRSSKDGGNTWSTFTALNTSSPGGPLTLFGAALFQDPALPFSCNDSNGAACDSRRQPFERRDLKNPRSSKKNSELLYRQAIDFNGDGRIDIVDAKEEKRHWVVYLNTPGDTPSQVRWVRVSLDVGALADELKSLGHHNIDDFLPLSSRYTGFEDRTPLCWKYDPGQPGSFAQVDTDICIFRVSGNAPPSDASTTELTWTEWELRDMNGDGYPDFVFNAQRVNDAPAVHYPDFGRPPQSGDVGWGSTGNRVGILGSGSILARLNMMGNHLADGVFVLTDNLAIRGGASVDVPTVPSPYNSASPTPTRPFSCGVDMWVDIVPRDPSREAHEQHEVCGFVDVNGDGIVDRVERTTAYLRNAGGFNYGAVVIPLPGLMGYQTNTYYVCSGGRNTAVQHRTIRDVNGDGIPDYVSLATDLANDLGPPAGVYFGTGVGFAPGIPFGDPIILSFVSEDCPDGTYSRTLSGLFDIDGDGKPEWLDRRSNLIDVYQLVGGAFMPGAPEAGRLVQVQNGYGATTYITYRSAKEDTFKPHPVPFPEIVVSKVETVGPPTHPDEPGPTLTVATSYAYSEPELSFDAVADEWLFTGYRRTVALSLTNGSQGVATISDTYGVLNPAGASTPVARFLDYAIAGHPSHVTTLSGDLGSDPWQLLGISVSDPRAISGTTYLWNASLFTEPSGTPCIDMVYPYDYLASYAAFLYDPCTAHGFIFPLAVSSWRGSAAPPSGGAVETFSQVLSVDDFGRTTMLLDGGDSHQSGDDKCVQITYATPAGTNERVLLAVSSLRTYANRDCTGAPRAADYFEYDCPAGSTSCPTVSAANPTGSVSKGFLTGHSVENRATDDGTLLGTARVLDSTLDTFGNPVTMTMTREEGATRTLTLTYDSFGIALVSARSAASGGPTTVPSMTTTITLDPLTMEVLGKTDPTGTRAGATYDGFGRILLSTITPPGGAEGALSSTVYSGFAVGQTGGRRITRTAFTDPVPVATAAAAAGRTSTLFLDELGRSLRTEVALGADYAATPTLVVGKRVYDALGRVVFEADPYTSNQDASSAYGTTSFFAADGTPTCSVRAYGQQPTLVATTDEASERYPTCASRSFSGHVEIVTTQDAASMLAGSPQEGVQKITFLSATGRTLKRYTRNSAFATQEDALFGYDFVGNLTSMRRFWYSSGIDSVTTTWRYDSRGRMIQLNEPASLPQYLSYDNWGQLVSSRWTDTSASPVVDRVMAHRYDALGRLVHTEEQREDHAVGTTETDPEAVYDYLYDTPVVVPSDGQVNPTYVLGRMAKATSPKSSVTFGYDAFGRTNARTFSDDQGGPNIEMRTFHGDGSLQTLRFVLPDRAYKGERVDYTYDSAGRGRTVKFTDGAVTQSLLNASMIDGLGRLREAQYGSTIYTASYADVGRRLPSDVTVSSLLALSAGGGTRKISFQPAGGLASAYDPVGRERVRTETKNGNPSAQPVFRTYDAIGRLASMSGPQPVTFQYDTLGNLLTQSYSAPFTSKDVGVGYDQPGLGSDDRDRMCRISYANSVGWGACKVLYDGIGDVVQMPTAGGGTRSLTYGASGQAHTISNSEGSNAHFFYDAFGAVQQLVVAGSTSDTRRDRHFGEHLLAHDEGAGNSVLTRRIELPGGSAIKHGASGKWVFQIGEQRGARFFIDQDGVFAQDVDYSPYGQSTSSGPASNPGSPLYSSVQWNDGDALAAFGVSQLGARIYDPVVGRFLSRDPLLTPDTGATTNPYAFANNDPINGSDPTGLSPLVPHTTRFGCCKVWRSIFNEQEDLLDFSAEDTAIMLGFTWGLVQRHGGHSALPTAADLPAGLNLDLTLVRNAAVLWTLTAKWNADPSHFTSITPVEYFSWYGLGPATNTLGIRLLSIGDGVIRGLMVADGLELADLARSLGAAAVSKVLTRELTEDASGLASRRWGSLASEREIISSVNPHGFQDACGQCAIALDSTWAGKPTMVTRNSGPMSTEEILEHYGQKLSDLIPAKSQREVAAALKARGPGSRAIIFADPANPAELGHVFNARNEGGVLTFADPSYGDIGSFTGYNQIWFFWTW